MPNLPPAPVLPLTNPAHVVSPISRGKQLRDLTQDALALMRRRDFNPLGEMIDTYLQVKGFSETLNIERTDQLKEFVAALAEDNVTREMVSAMKDLLEASNEQILMAQRLKLDILKELTQYAVPKLRSVEHTGEINTGISITLGVAPKQVVQVPVDRLKLGREDTLQLK